MNPMDPEPIPGVNTSPETPTAEVTEPTDAERADAALEKLAAIGGENFDRSQMEALKAKLAKIGKSDALTTSGSESPDAPVVENNRPLTGRDVDWSEYNLDFNVAHLYTQAVYRETPQGPKWVAMITDFHTTMKDFRNYGKKVNAPHSNDKTDVEALNLGEYLNDKVNGREAWKVAAVMPVGTQCGVLLERQVPIILPDPQPLKKSEEVEAPTDPALAAVEDAALAFAAEQEGVEKPLTDQPEDETISGEAHDIGLRPIERGTVEHEAALEQLDETGAVAARTGVVVSKALEAAAPLTVQAPTAGVVQPDAVPNPLLGNAPVPAAGYSAAQDLLRALNDPSFRAKLPSEE
jgi:hypothetical protein